VRCHLLTRECSHAFDTALYERVMAVVDLVLLDATSLRFAPSELVAALMLILRPAGAAVDLHTVTGYRAAELQACVQWLRPYTDISSREPSQWRRSSKNPGEAHTIQSHHPDAMSIVENRWQAEEPTSM
jgi:hypothetical protein